MTTATLGHRRRNRWRAVRPTAALLLAAWFFLPLFLVLVNVFKDSDAIVANPAALPLDPTLDNLLGVVDRADGLFWFGLVNSVQITALSVAVAVVLSAMLGYYLARSTGTVGKILLLLLLAGLTIPAAVLLTSLTDVLRSLGLMGSVFGVVVSNVGYYVPFGTFVFMGFVQSVPIEVEEAAAIDGASRPRIFWQIVFPLMKPAMASVVIFLSVWIWNDFLNPLIILGPSNGTTVTVGVYRAIGERDADYGQVFAFMLLASLPVIIFYLLFQRSFVKGLTGGATK